MNLRTMLKKLVTYVIPIKPQHTNILNAITVRNMSTLPWFALFRKVIRTNMFNILHIFIENTMKEKQNMSYSSYVCNEN